MTMKGPRLLSRRQTHRRLKTGGDRAANPPPWHASPQHVSAAWSPLAPGTTLPLPGQDATHAAPSRSGLPALCEHAETAPGQQPSTHRSQHTRKHVGSGAGEQPEGLGQR